MGKFEPLYDQILVLEVSMEQNIDGIILPETSRDDVKFGKVIQVGEGYIQLDGSIRPLRLKQDEVVAYGMYAGIPIRIEGVEFKVMKEGECIGRIKDE